MSFGETFAGNPSVGESMDPMKMKIVEMGMVFASGVVGMGCFTAVVTQWIKSRRPSSVGDGETITRLDQLGERLSHLENATDSIAIEVERISEGQRFTTKL